MTVPDSYHSRAGSGVFPLIWATSREVGFVFGAWVSHGVEDLPFPALARPWKWMLVGSVCPSGRGGASRWVTRGSVPPLCARMLCSPSFPLNCTEIRLHQLLSCVSLDSDPAFPKALAPHNPDRAPCYLLPPLPSPSTFACFNHFSVFSLIYSYTLALVCFCLFSCTQGSGAGAWLVEPLLGNELVWVDRGVNWPKPPVHLTSYAVVTPGFPSLSLQPNWAVLTQHYSHYHMLSVRAISTPKLSENVIPETLKGLPSLQALRQETARFQK